jgi:Fe2+ or Zn2+ uptake regulation protein
MSSDFGRVPVVERLPANYRTILEAIRGVEAGTHLSAQDVYTRARARQPKLGFATVHRALARLNQLGYIAKLDVPGAASAVYERASAPHAHFRCVECGIIRDVDFTVPQELLAALAARHGMQIEAESTTFAGRCATCAVPDDPQAEPAGRPRNVSNVFAGDDGRLGRQAERDGRLGRSPNAMDSSSEAEMNPLVR